MFDIIDTGQDPPKIVATTQGDLEAARFLCERLADSDRHATFRWDGKGVLWVTALRAEAVRPTTVESAYRIEERREYSGDFLGLSYKLNVFDDQVHAEVWTLINTHAQLQVTIKRMRENNRSNPDAATRETVLMLSGRSSGLEESIRAILRALRFTEEGVKP